MTAWTGLGAADFDARLADKRAVKRAAEDAAAGQAGLFFLPTPEREAKPAPGREEMPGQAAMFGDGSEPALIVTQAHRDSSGAVSAVTLRAADGATFTLARRARESGPVWVLSGADCAVWSDPAAYGMARWFCPGHGASKVCPYGAHDEIRFTGTLPGHR